jgi:quercetin dioxygenase-like cupin family protein
MSLFSRTGASLTTLILALAFAATAAAAGKSTVTSKTDVKWTASTIPGVSTAAVEGDMTKGPSHFYLKYAKGFVAPLHHHSPDHFATTVSGQLVLIMDGKESTLAPGSFFAFTGMAAHGARCEGTEDCVMFIDARGPWDVVLEAAAKP